MCLPLIHSIDNILHPASPQSRRYQNPPSSSRSRAATRCLSRVLCNPADSRTGGSKRDLSCLDKDQDIHSNASIKCLTLISSQGHKMNASVMKLINLMATKGTSVPARACSRLSAAFKGAFFQLVASSSRCAVSVDGKSRAGGASAPGFSRRAAAAIMREHGPTDAGAPRGRAATPGRGEEGGEHLPGAALSSFLASRSLVCSPGTWREGRRRECDGFVLPIPPKGDQRDLQQPQKGTEGTCSSPVTPSFCLPPSCTHLLLTSDRKRGKPRMESTPNRDILTTGGSRAMPECSPKATQS